MCEMSTFFPFSISGQPYKPVSALKQFSKFNRKNQVKFRKLNEEIY